MKQAIHCKTQEEFNKVLEIFEKKGWKWRSGNKPTGKLNYWKECDIQTLDYKDGFGYGDSAWVKENGYQIISFEEFLKLENIMQTQDVKKEIEILEQKLQELKKQVETSNTSEYKKGEWLYCWYNNNKEDIILFRFNRRENYIFHYTESYKIENGKVRSICENDYICNSEWTKNIIRPSKDQIENVLKIVAEYKGFKEGTKVDQVPAYGCGKQYIIPNEKVSYTNWNGDNFAMGDIGIYHEGKWAEIIKEYSTTVDGYKFEINKQKKEVKFGCKILTLEDLKAIKRVCELNVQFNGYFEVSEDDIVVMGENNQRLTIEQIEKLIKELEK